MAVSLHSTAVSLNVGISAYLLTVAVFILPSGWAAQRYGTRAVFAAAVAVFTLGSVLCGSAGSANSFIAFRVLQGLGGAMMVPVGRLAVLRTTPKHKLIGAIAVLTWPGLTAPVLAPPLAWFPRAAARPDRPSTCSVSRWGRWPASRSRACSTCSARTARR